MWNVKPIRQCDPVNSRFIHGIREEHRRNDILSDVFKRSSAENPSTRNINFNIDLCGVLVEENRKKFIEAKRRQHLRENNHELRELERQLKAAHVMKTLEAQRFERKSVARERTAEAMRSELILENSQYTLMENARRQEEEAKAKRAALKHELQQQIAISNAKRMEKYELMLKEKQILEAKRRMCEKENQLALLAAEQRKIQKRAELEAYMKAREEWKISQNMSSEKENERINAIIAARELQLQKEKEEKQLQRLRKEQISERIGKEIHAKAEKEALHRDLLAELLVDERQAKEETRMRSYFEQQKRERDAIRYQMALDVEERERRKLAQKKIDEEYFNEHMRMLAERDKLEQLSDEKRRQKKMEHRRLLQEGLDEKKRLSAEHTKDLIREREQQVQDEKRMQQLVDEERIRILQENANGILGYLAPGILRNSDRQYFSIPTKRN